MAQVVLLTATMAQWPAAITQRSFEQASPSEWPTDLSQTDWHHCYWLGYSSPLDCLHQALNGDGEADIASLLNRWQQEVEALLQLKRTQPQNCKLLNLPRLTHAAIEVLLDTSQAAGEQTPEDREDQIDNLWPGEPSALAKLVISQRRDLSQLYADLEAQADLLGREPEFQLDLPSSHEPGLGAALVLEWQQQRRLAAQQTRLQSDHLNHLRALQQDSQQENKHLQERCNQLEAELQQARHQAKSLSDRATDLMESLRLSESQLAAEISRSAENAAEAVAQLRDCEEEKELILLQFKQVQEELENTFQALQSHQSNRQQLEDNCRQYQQQHDHLQSELQSLAQESRYLFLHSQLLDTADRTRLSRILHLMRQSLQA